MIFYIGNLYRFGEEMVCFVLHLFPIMFHWGSISILQVSWTPIVILDDFLQVKTEKQFTQCYQLKLNNINYTKFHSKVLFFFNIIAVKEKDNCYVMSVCVSSKLKDLEFCLIIDHMKVLIPIWDKL